MFFILKIQEFFFLYSPKQVFKNRKQKLLLNLALVFSTKKKKKIYSSHQRFVKINSTITNYFTIFLQIVDIANFLLVVI